MIPACQDFFERCTSEAYVECVEEPDQRLRHGCLESVAGEERAQNCAVFQREKCHQDNENGHSCFKHHHVKGSFDSELGGKFCFLTLRFPAKGKWICSFW